MWQYHPLLLVFQLGVLISIGVAAVCAHRLRRHGYSLVVVSVGLLAVCIALYNTAATLKVASPGLQAKLWWYKLEFLGSASLPSVALVLALAHLGHERWLTWPVVGMLVGLPAVAIPLIIWNPGHVMIVEPRLVAVGGGLQALEHKFPPLFVILSAWGQGIFLFAALLAGYGGVGGKTQRASALLISAALLIPVVAILLKSLHVYPPGGDGINITSAFCTVTLALIALAIGRYRLFDLLPLGRTQALGVMNDGYVLVGPTGQVVDANAAARTLLGEEVLVGRPANDLLPPSEERLFLKRRSPGGSGALSAAAHSGAAGPFRLEVQGRVLQAQSTTIRHGTEFAGQVVMLHDITALRERERQLEQQNERLEGFAGIVSHDLRNPLNVARGRLELSLESVNGESVEGPDEEGPDEEGSDGIRGSEAQGDEAQGDEAQGDEAQGDEAHRGGLLGHLEATGRALGRMDAIIEDVLTLTWGGRDLRPDDLSPRSLGALAEAAWDQVDTAEARLQLDAPPSFRCDKDRLQRLLENLFRNAIEHAGEAAVVRVGGLSGGFYVEDNGPGIPEAERETVLRGGYSSQEEGTGLGLSIVQGIAEAHGWSLSVTESGEGGARLEFRGAEPQSG